MNDIAAYIAGFFFVTTMGSIHFLDKKTVKIVTLEAQVATMEKNNKDLRESVSLQNDLILKYKIDLKASEERWNSREPVIEYVDRWKTEFVERESNETCDDILNAIRANGF